MTIRTSSDTNVAEVHPIDSVSAYVYTTGFGSATITVTSGLARAELPVRVELAVVHAVIFPQEVRIHALNGTALLRLQAYAANGQIVQPAVAWESSNPAVATVSNIGVVTARANGTTEVRALVNGVVAATRTVTVEATSTAPVLSFTTPTMTFYRPGDAYTLTAVRRGAANEATSLPSLTMATGNASVVTLDQNLLLTAVGAGAASVSA